MVARIRNSHRKTLSAQSPVVLDCARELDDIRLRLETVLSVATVAASALYAQMVDIDHEAATALRRCVNDPLCTHIEQLNHIILKLKGMEPKAQDDATDTH